MLFAGAEVDRSEIRAHPPQADHAAGQTGRLLEVVLGAGRHFVVDDHLGGPATQQHRQAPEQEGAAVVMPILFRHLHRHAEGAPAGHDAHLPQRIGARCEVGDQGVSRLVIGDHLALLGVHQAGARGAEQDLVQSLFEVGRR